MILKVIAGREEHFGVNPPSDWGKASFGEPNPGH
jgi:hypothetical protein